MVAQILKKITNIVCKKIKYQLFKIKWIKKNKNNYTRPLNFFPLDMVSVGKYSYGALNIKYWDIEKEKLEIGNFVSIAEGVVFILGGNHNINTFTTYPLKAKFFSIKNEAWTKGKIVIEDDVWIGMNALILSGVTIGKGAIICAGAVVVKNIPPYAVVGGNPATVIKYRHSKEIINKLLKINFIEIEFQKNKKDLELLYEKLTLEKLVQIEKIFIDNKR